MGKPKKPILYVIGPISGYSDDNRTRFDSAKKKLEAAGYKVLLPHDFVKPGTAWPIAMRISISKMLTMAHGVAVLDGQWTSRGAAIEQATALDCNMPVHKVSKWVDIAPNRQVV